MSEKEELLLTEADFYRTNFQFPKAISRLHQLVELSPKNEQYRYLLAATYMQAKNMQAAINTANELLAINPDNKEAIDLLGLIATEEKRYTDAESYFLKALDLDPAYFDARLHLIELYFKYLRNDEALETHAKYMLEYQDVDRDTYPQKKLIKVASNWLYLTLFALMQCLGRQHKFEEAIEIVRYKIQLNEKTIRRYKSLDSINDYGYIYKFYYLMRDNENLEKFKKEYQEVLGRSTEDCQYSFKNYEHYAPIEFP